MTYAVNDELLWYAKFKYTGTYLPLFVVTFLLHWIFLLVLKAFKRISEMSALHSKMFMVIHHLKKKKTLLFQNV